VVVVGLVVVVVGELRGTVTRRCEVKAKCIHGVLVVAISNIAEGAICLGIHLSKCCEPRIDIRIQE
jgi:hypothetical protein